ncbi:hypothetical protein [Candidatus Ichthyocystis sparus]|uniref:hypothetical protein n=1 Tax=Candidatus Ichthyocystis sparus TaxID=1561004 RepID=UPI000B81BA5B|nr:hypothetical protein [Candidatus Ichthyocystis sparus]
MCCINVRDHKLEDSIEFVHQDVDEISEDSESTTLVINERGENLRSASSSSIGRFLYNAYSLSPLIVLSMLGRASGIKFNKGVTFIFKRDSCSLAADICKIIAIDKMAGNSRDYFNLTKSAFIYSSKQMKEYNERLIREASEENIKKYTVKEAFNFSFPLIIPSNISSDDREGRSIISQLFYLDEWIVLETKRNYGESYEKIYHLNNYCFCKSYNPNISIYPYAFVFNRFCSNIGSYVFHPGLSSITGTLNATSIVATTEVVPTEVVPTDRDDVTFFIALVTFIFFTVSILSFLGRRCCRRY